MKLDYLRGKLDSCAGLWKMKDSLLPSNGRLLFYARLSGNFYAETLGLKPCNKFSYQRFVTSFKAELILEQNYTLIESVLKHHVVCLCSPPPTGTVCEDETKR